MLQERKYLRCVIRESIYHKNFSVLLDLYVMIQTGEKSKIHYRPEFRLKFFLIKKLRKNFLIHEIYYFLFVFKLK